MPPWKQVMLISLIAVAGSRCGVSDREDIAKLPYCIDEEDVGYVLVSTLDGKLSALQANGNLAWEVDTGGGPLLQSSIHNVELTNQGEMVRIIPSLSGSLYKFNGKTIDAIPIDADTLLKSSFVYSSDTVIAGKREVQTYGVVARTGDLLYECSSDGCRNITQVEDEFDDIIVIERSTATVRAHEPRSGYERWNFSVGYHNIKIPPASCINLDSAITSLNITAILPEGILSVNKKGSGEHLWRYVFQAPIVKVWKWDGRDLYAVDVFASSPARRDVFALTLAPAIYLGMHNKQLYIHESAQMSRGRDLGVASFPWKPIPAGGVQDDVDDATAISVLYSSNYIDGNGYYLYTESDQRKTIFCEGTNGTSKFFSRFETGSIFKTTLVTLGFVIMTAVAMQFKTITGWFYNPPKETTQNKDTSETFETGATEVSSLSSIYNDARPIQSHFLDKYDIICQLGKGGYGIVFEVQQKIDKVNYAIKIIPLPQRPVAKERVLREVRALAKLDHPNIVRYSTAWDEDALPDLNHVRQTALDASLFNSDFYEEEEEESELEHAKISIEPSDTGTHEDDSFIVFENETRTRSNSMRFTVQDSAEVELTASERHITRSRKTSEKSKERKYLFIQMQLCDKRTLKHWLTETPKRASSTIYEIYGQILQAVEYIHSKELIHRDLKPSNIFFNASGIKVGDFGLATPMQDTDGGDSTMENARVGHTRDAGTALYMSPEQKKGSQYNYKVDIFSLGVILFELLVYFDTESERIRVLQNLREGRFPEQFQCSYQQEHYLLKRMLSPKASERPTVTEVIKHIEDFTL